jgi:hypothetical protein
MILTVSMPRPQRKMSVQMRCVLTVLEADPYLKTALSPHIDFHLESINWDRIFELRLGSGHSTVVSWLYALWVDEPRPDSNVFGGTFNLSSGLQTAILDALALRWGLIA